MTEKMRSFESGATRSSEEGKYDYEGFLSPRVLERYAQYMNENRVQADGNLRASDNWQKGMGLNVYMKSMWRHFMSLWKLHRGLKDPDTIEVALCALMFNVMGYMHEVLVEKEGLMPDMDKYVGNLAAMNKPLGEYLGEFPVMGGTAHLYRGKAPEESSVTKGLKAGIQELNKSDAFPRTYKVAPTSTGCQCAVGCLCTWWGCPNETLVPVHQDCYPLHVAG